MTAGDDLVTTAIHEHRRTIDDLLTTCHDAIAETGAAIVGALGAGRAVFLCGNGGSAADAQHIAAELVGRFEGERRAYPALALTTDPSAVSAISNDYGFEHVFARQLAAFAKPGDVLVAISTSGSSANVIRAVMEARRIGCVTIGLTGAAGARLASLCERTVMVPAHRTSRIQEAHIVVGHVWCAMVDRALGPAGVSRPEGPAGSS